jgi:cytochrome c peroxidase
MRPALLIAMLLLVVGCQPAHRFPPVEKKTPISKTQPATTPAASFGWLVPTDEIDSDPPLRFIAREPGREKQWDALPAFWNRFPPPGAGASTVHIGLDPLGAALSVIACNDLDAIEIKVPRHLGAIPIDPNNPPTVGRWQLGRKIFFEPVLTQGGRRMACADCHRPDHGFSDGLPPTVDGDRRIIGLLDVAVRRPLFWDGRASRLEEVFAPVDPSGDRLRTPHRWDGVAERLDKIDWYRLEFRRVMGLQRVTQDGVAKALAVYLRTLLAGDSLLDRAGGPPEAMHAPAAIAAVLDDGELRQLNRLAGIEPPLPKKEIARRIAEGEQLAFGAGRCYDCHPAPGALGRPLGFHNTLVGDSGGGQQARTGKETGRFMVEPIGRKDFTMRGAYRAPPLRNLLARAPYFHDGSKRSLRDVLEHYNLVVDVDHPLLDPILRDLVRSSNVRAPGGRLVPWNEEQVDALVLYLAACEGETVDPIVNRP